MKNTDYVKTPAGIRRVRAIAKEINRLFGITMPQCMEMARAEVSRWAFTVSHDGLHANKPSPLPQNIEPSQRGF